jgi:hypothetical protein
MKRRRQQLALLLVRLAERSQHRARAEERLHRARREDGEQLGVTVAEQLADQLGLGGHDHATVERLGEEAGRPS